MRSAQFDRPKAVESRGEIHQHPPTACPELQKAPLPVTRVPARMPKGFANWIAHAGYGHYRSENTERNQSRRGYHDRQTHPPHRQPCPPSRAAGYHRRLQLCPIHPVVATPTPAEAGCLRDVAATTNNSEVTIISSFASEAGTGVTVGVGPDRAPWRCIGYNDGTTAAIVSLVDEGAL